MYVPEIWSAKDRLFCRFGPFFALLLQPKDPENENLEKNEKKKKPGDIIILQMCTVYHDDMYMLLCNKNASLFILFLVF